MKRDVHRSGTELLFFVVRRKEEADTSADRSIPSSVAAVLSEFQDVLVQDCRQGCHPDEL